MLAVLTLEIGLIFSLYTGDIPFLRRSEEGLFQTCLSWVREVNPRETLLETNPEADGWRLLSLNTEERPLSGWSFLEMPLAPELFDGETPKPSEYAILLAKAHQSGVRELVFSQALSWEKASELDLLALERSLRPFPKVLLPLDLSEVPNPPPTPEWLRDSFISPSQLVGDGSSLPLVNQVSLPPSVNGRAGVSFAFPGFGAREIQFRTPERLPLLARWENDLLLSWPLRVAMLLEGVEPSQLLIAPGQHLRLGATGPVIALDRFGRAKLDEVASAKTELNLQSAKELFPLDDVDLPKLEEKALLLDITEPRKAEESRRRLDEALALLRFPRPTQEETFRRLTLGWEVLLYFQIVLVAIFALHLRSFWQLVTLVVLCGGLTLFALALLNWRGLWTPVIPLAMAITLSWCLIGYLQQIAHPVRRKAL